jgi:hypothetical protein
MLEIESENWALSLTVGALDQADFAGSGRFFGADEVEDLLIEYRKRELFF